jgi:hypothetical protein
VRETGCSSGGESGPPCAAPLASLRQSDAASSRGMAAGSSLGTEIAASSSPSPERTAVALMPNTRTTFWRESD